MKNDKTTQSIPEDTPAAEKRRSGQGDASDRLTAIFEYLEKEKTETVYRLESLKLKVQAAKSLGYDINPGWLPDAYTSPQLTGSEALTRLFSRKEAADFLGISTRTLYNYIKEGRIEVIEFSGKNVRISKDALDKFLGKKRE